MRAVVNLLYGIAQMFYFVFQFPDFMPQGLLSDTFQRLGKASELALLSAQETVGDIFLELVDVHLRQVPHCI